jgi:Zn-finger nucleic acid-binding protein
MEARTLNCPMCGASASTDATKCQHCGARLATIACPSCFGMIFRGAKFCCHCGAGVARKEVPADVRMPCPRCRVNMHAVVVGTSPLRECPKCDGLWADKDTLHQICSDHERQAAVLGTPAVLPADLIGNVEKNIRYVPCPVCKALMNRVNFSRCSHVVVDVCSKHGTWFDQDELRRVVEFIRAGGMDKARAQEMRELERRRQQLASAQAASSVGGFDSVPSPRYSDARFGIELVADVLGAILD